MNTRTCLMICLVLFLSYGCASHKAAVQPNLSYDLNSQENKVDRDGITLMVKVFHLESELTTYFDDDVLKYGMLPIQINLHNKSNPNAIVMNIDGINLIDPTGTRSPGLSCEQTYDKMKRSQWRSAGWGLAAGIFGIIPSLINVSNTNDKIKADIEARMIKDGNIINGGMTEGMTFFMVPEEVSSLSGWKVAVILKDIQNATIIVLEYGLSGTIISPKERNAATNQPSPEKSGLKEESKTTEEKI
jgi:hypothetical protein